MECERWRADRLDTRLLQGRLAPAHVRAVGAALARWHLEEPPVASATDLAERLEALRARLLDADCDAARVETTHARLARLLASDRARFEARAAAARRAHGGLGLDAVFVDTRGNASLGEPAEVGAADPARDVAHLALALRKAGRADLAERFVAAYAEAADDFALYPTLSFYEPLAALERAARAADRGEASRWLATVTAAAPHAARPQLVAVGGRAASGKSTVARRLAAELCAPLVSADELHDPVGDEWSLFLALARRAEPVLDSGRPVVIDASFASQATRRAAARLARERGSPLLFTECCAYEDTLRRRLAERASAAKAAAEWEPVRDLEGGIHVVVDTNRPEPRGFARVRRVLPVATSLVA